MSWSDDHRKLRQDLYRAQRDVWAAEQLVILRYIKLNELALQCAESGMTYAQIAEVLERSSNRVEQMLQKARRQRVADMATRASSKGKRPTTAAKKQQKAGTQ